MKGNLLIYEVREKWNRTYLFLIYFLQLGVLFFYHLIRQSSDLSMHLQIFQNVQKSALLELVCLTFLSYEIFCDFQKKEWRELLELKDGGIWKAAAVKDLLMILLIIIEFAALFAVEWIKMAVVYVDGRGMVSGNLCRVMILNALLLPLTGAVIGKTAALLSRKRWSGYLWILIILLLGCGLFERINTALFMTTGVNMDGIFRFFQFEQPNSAWVVDDLYLIPAENYRFCMYLTWIAGCSALLCLVRMKRRAVWAAGTAVCLCICVLSALQVSDPGNCVNYNWNMGSAANKQTGFAQDAPAAEWEADFSVRKYRMDLRIMDELYAETVMFLGEEKTDLYRFTLYRGYELTEVTDENGNALEYDRRKDYITIDAPEGLSEIHMSYHGYQQSFYSNKFGVMLPGYFAYYPQPGFRQVFLDERIQSYGYYGFQTEADSLQEAEYEIRVVYDQPVYSNLKQVNGSFSGITAAPTLMGGMAAEEFREDGHYMYPAVKNISNFSLQELKASLGEYCEILGIEPEAFAGLRHVIVVPSSVYIGNSWGKNVIVGDCLFLGTDQVTLSDPDKLAEEVVKQYMDVRGERDLLESILFAVLDGSRYLEDLEPLCEEQFFAVSYDENDPMSEEYWKMIEGMEQERMFLTLIDACGKEEVVRRTAEYLMEEKPVENSAEFMQRLYLELEVN